MATFLIDGYENLKSPTSSTPCKRRRNMPLPPASSLHPETLFDRADDFLDAQDVEDTNPATTFQSMDTSALIVPFCPSGLSSALIVPFCQSGPSSPLLPIWCPSSTLIVPFCPSGALLVP
ncbi:unnamed protein product [Boreogadus saida]